MGGQNLLRQCSCSNSLLRYYFGRLKTDEAMLFFNSLLGYFCWGGQKLRQCSFSKSLLQYSFGRFENCMVLVIVFWALHAWSALIQTQVHLSMLLIHSQLWFASFPCFFHLVLIKMGVCQHFSLAGHDELSWIQN